MLKKIVTAILLIISAKCFAQKFSISVDNGFSYRLFAVNDSLTEDFQSYQEKKKYGYNFSIEPVWYSEGNGIGIKYSVFRNKVSGDSIYVDAFERYSISEKLNLQYLGLQYHRILKKPESKFSGNFVVGLGTIFYRNNRTEYQHVNIAIKGRTYALNASAAIEYTVIKQLTLYFTAGIYIANISEVEENGYTVFYNPKEGLTRLDFGSGLRINIF